MRLVIGMLTCLGLGSAGLASADPPANAAAPAPAASQASAAPSPASASATPSAAAATSAPVMIESTKEKESDSLEKHFLAEGYKIETHNGEKYFCRREETLGTRLGGQKTCATAQQLQATEREAQAAFQRGQSQQSNPKGN